MVSTNELFSKSNGTRHFCVARTAGALLLPRHLPYCGSCLGVLRQPRHAPDLQRNELVWRQLSRDDSTYLICVHRSSLQNLGKCFVAIDQPTYTYFGEAADCTSKLVAGGTVFVRRKSRGIISPFCSLFSSCSVPHTRRPRLSWARGHWCCTLVALYLLVASLSAAVPLLPLVDTTNHESACVPGSSSHTRRV